ncbi:ABC transporter permease [Yinghuangia soli]|uniref:ABC transporter permease n=1 Tax=Yinghuangia soli TaxID=2908204 RepID=A0AA41Q8I4_9ACTN|nr:ABC transporter permease [Yinghuangia soli]MCF2532865.1 ABC transporter permease [Yinghuangia soli]
MLRARRGQVAALAVTVFFSAVLVGAFGVLLETGVRGKVATGEYSGAPLLVAAEQAVPVDGDVDMTVPGRALLPAALADEIRAALPGSRVVADRIVPAVLGARSGGAEPVDAHPWSAFALGDRELAAGRAPEGPGEIVLPGHAARARGLEIGARTVLGFGDQAVAYTLVGTTTADDSGVDVPDVYLSDQEIGTLGNPDRSVAAIGVWPQAASRADVLPGMLAPARARLWDGGDRGPVEAVSQGRAKATLVSAAGALGALAFIVAVFTVIALTSLQIRERSRELAMLRIVGATPRQVKRLLRSEIRMVAGLAGGLGGLVGPFAGAALIGVIRSWGVLPRTLEPVYGPLPFAVAMLTGLVAAETATRVAVRRVARSSPLGLLDGGDANPPGAPRTGRRTALGLALLAIGIVMALAPAYTSNVDAASGLPGISGLVMALSIGPLSPYVVRAAAAAVRRPAMRTAAAYMALGSIRHRAARVGGALTPIVLGVALGAVQLSGAATVGAVSAAQAEAGARTDLTVTVPGPGIGERTAELVRGVTGVGSATPFVAAGVIVQPPAGSGNSPQTLNALGIAGDQVEQYAELEPTGGDPIRLREGEVALGVLGAAQLGARVGDRVTVVLGDGRALTRQVGVLYERGLGFGEVLLPLADLLPATASGRASGLAVTVPGSASAAQVADGIRDRLADVPGAEVTGSTGGTGGDAAGGEEKFGLLILLVLFGYIAIAVANSLVTATLSRRSEFALLAAVGATPRQRRSVLRWEAAVLAATACLVGTAFALPGLVGMTYALSNGDRLMPAIDPVAFTSIVAFTFVLVFSATALAGRSVLRAPR